MSPAFADQPAAWLRVRASRSWLLMLPILLLAASLGMQLMGDDAIWVDEWYSYYFAGAGDYSLTTVAGTPCEALPGSTHTVAHLLCLVMAVDTGPPLHYLLLMVWDHVSQGALVVDRYSSLLLGLIAIATTYRLSVQLFGRRAGLFAGLMLGTSAFFIHYLHELRGYTLFVLLIGLIGWLYWLLSRSTNPRRSIRWGFALAIAGALYTHFVSIPIIAGLGAYHLLLGRPSRKKLALSDFSDARRRWARLIRLGFNGTLLFVPWIAVLLITFTKEAAVSRSIGLGNTLAQALDGYTNGLWLIAVILLLASLRQVRLPAVRFLWAWLAIAVVLTGAGNLVADVLFHPRHIMGVMPILYALMAGSLATLSRRVPWATSLFVGVWAGIGIASSADYTFMARFPLQEPPTPLAAISTMTQVASSCAEAGDALVLGLRETEREWVMDAPVIYYFGASGARYLTYSRLLSDESLASYPSPIVPRELHAAGAQARLDNLIQDAGQVFVMALQQAPVQSETYAIGEMLRTNGFSSCGPLIENEDLIGLVYSRSPDDCAMLLNTCQGAIQAAGLGGF